MNMLAVDDLCFEVRRSAVRRTLEITVDRSGDLILSAPAEASEAILRDFVQRKRMWIYQQLARQETLTREVPNKIFVDGEGFLYLGRNFRLRLVDESIAPVKLVGGRFVMPRTLASEGREHMIRWYCQREPRRTGDPRITPPLVGQF